LQEIGRVLHLSPNRSLILRAEKPPRIGDDVFDETFKPVGRVFDVFGPISAPYVAVKAFVKDPNRLVDRILYFSGRLNKKRKRGRGKK
jgi:RNA-binding protein